MSDIPPSMLIEPAAVVMHCAFVEHATRVKTAILRCEYIVKKFRVHLEPYTLESLLNELSGENHEQITVLNRKNKAENGNSNDVRKEIGRFTDEKNS